MNPRDLPEVVAELSIKMHEVRAEVSAPNGRADRPERVMENGFQGLRDDMCGLHEDRQTPDRLGAAMRKSPAPFLNRLPAHGDQRCGHGARLGKLETPQ